MVQLEKNVIEKSQEIKLQTGLNNKKEKCGITNDFFLLQRHMGQSAVRAYS